MDILCEVEPHEPGPFRCPAMLTYFDGGDYHGVTLSVRGTWIAPRPADHAAKATR